jgi:hypothetical protein
MDSSDMKRLRAPGFPIARRGYEQRAVDMFLARLADWLETDAATDLGQVAVARKLELVGKSTAHILLATEQESEQMRRRAHEECAELRSEAKAAALATRQAADEYATKVRDKAEQDARRAADAASAKAKQDKLQAEIGSTIERHRPGKPRQGARGSDRTNDRAEKPADGAGQPTERRPKQGRAAAPPSSR